MGKQTGAQAARPGPPGPGSPPATRSQQGERHDHDGHPEDDRETGLDAYVARLVDEAPPLSSETRSRSSCAARPGGRPVRGRRAGYRDGCTRFMAYRHPPRYGPAERIEQVMLARGTEDGLSLAGDALLSRAARAPVVGQAI